MTRIEAKERGWHLNSEGEFASPSSAEFPRGVTGDLDSLTGIFPRQNEHINPFFRQTHLEESDSSTTSDPESNELRFGLERDLQRALRTNIRQLEPGLVITDGGSEKIVEAGRIDITAADSEGSLVVIELKAGLAQAPDVTQLLAYMGTIENPEGRTVRGILIANDFAPRVIQAAKAVPTIALKAYSFQFSFHDR